MSNKIYSYRDLEVWKKSKKLVVSIYQTTESFPKQEVYGLTSQIRRSAVSVPSNIAEGKSRRTTKEYMRFLDIAYGSIAELETQLDIACELGYLKQAQLEELLLGYAEVGKMLNGLLTSLEQKVSFPLNPESRILTPEEEDA